MMWSSEWTATDKKSRRSIDESVAVRQGAVAVMTTVRTAGTPLRIVTERKKNHSGLKKTDYNKRHDLLAYSVVAALVVPWAFYGN